MKNFMDSVERHNADETPVDPSAEFWAARAFAVVVALGNHDCINDEVGEALAAFVAKAPDSVVMDGTLMILGARAKVENGYNW